jgi:branched-chain amino acid transport system permease protein
MLTSTIWRQQKVALFVIPLSLILLAFAPRVLSASVVISLIGVLMYLVLTLAWTMFSGPTRLVSLATAALFGLGMYACAILRGHLPIELIVLIAAAVSFMLAVAVGLLTLRLRGVYFILFTFGITALIGSIAHWWETHVTHSVGRHVTGASNETVYVLLLILFAGVLVASFLLRNSASGLALEAIGENQEAAQHIGVNVTRLKVLTFAVSATFVGATGAVMATRLRYVDPSIAFNPLISFLPVVMAIFGGTSKLYGPILGGLILVVLREFLITEHPYVYLLIFGITLVVVVLWLPGGLVVLAQRWAIKAKVWWIKLRMRVRRMRSA